MGRPPPRPVALTARTCGDDRRGAHGGVVVPTEPGTDTVSAVSVWQTVVVFAVVPLAAFGLLALLVFAPSASRAPRYRPGRPWEYDPVWYVARPEAALASGPGRAAIAAAAQPAPGAGGGAPAAVLDVPARTARGGASGQW